MKKTIFLLALVLAAGGAVWAQSLWITADDVMYASNYLKEWDFNAVQTESIESRFSVQRFTSDVDNYIDTRFFDPQIGTFVFMGGYLYNSTLATGLVNFGFGKTIGKTYAGVFYCGRLVNWQGYKEENADGTFATKSDVGSTNNLAALFGIAGMGFRFDLKMDDGFIKYTYDGAVTEEIAMDGKTSAALSWGATFGGLNLTPWARIGYKFPKVETTTDSSKANPPNTAAPTRRMTDTYEALLGAQVGALYRLTDTDAVVAEVNYTKQFAREVKGDSKYIKESVTGAADGPDPYKEGGGWGANLSAYYQKEIGFSKMPGLTLKVKPRLKADFVSWSQSSTETGSQALTYDFPTANWFTLSAGLDAGAEYRYKKIALYTGFCLDIIEWKTIFLSGNDAWKNLSSADNDSDSAWDVRGMIWRDTITNSSIPVLKFGLTFTPINNLVIGAGLNVSVGNLFNFNIKEMKIDNNISGVNDVTRDIFGRTDIVLTVSYRF